MLILVQLDISEANMGLFEEYETQMFALLKNHGGQLLERLRSANGKDEVHLLHFAENSTFDAFRADPVRKMLQELWVRCRASSKIMEVQRVL